MLGLNVNLGQERSTGKDVSFDLRKGPHVLIAGTTGSGKSVAIHAMLCDLLQANTPWDCGLVLIDPKRVELADYAGLPHVAGPDGPGVIYRDPIDALRALAWVLAQVSARFELMESVGARDISDVPWAAMREAGQPRAMVMVVDELADLMMASKSIGKSKGQGTPYAREALTDAETTLARILQIGRAAGVHAILATQRPSSDIVTGVIKANCPTRLTFALQSAVDSRVAFGRKGAEELTGKGDALFLPVGQREPNRIQGRMVSDAERLEVIARWSSGKQSGAVAGRQQGSDWLGDVAVPAEPIGSGRRGEVSKRQARIHNRWVARAEVWNGAGRRERAVATVMANVTVLGVGGWALAYSAWKVYLGG